VSWCRKVSAPSARVSAPTLSASLSTASTSLFSAYRGGHHWAGSTAHGSRGDDQRPPGIGRQFGLVGQEGGAEPLSDGEHRRQGSGSAELLGVSCRAASRMASGFPAVPVTSRSTTPGTVLRPVSRPAECSALSPERRN